MSIILRGDLLSNFGEFLPAPFIKSVEISDSSVTLTISIFLQSSLVLSERTSFDDLIETLSEKTNLCIHLTAWPERFKEIISGNVNPLAYAAVDPVLTTQQEEPLYYGDSYFIIDDIFASTVDSDGNLDYTYLINKDIYTDDGHLVWEFQTEKTIQYDAGSGDVESYLGDYDIKAIVDTKLLYYNHYEWNTNLTGEPELNAAYDSDARASHATAQDEWADAYYAAVAAGTTEASDPLGYWYEQNIGPGHSALGLYAGAFTTLIDVNDSSAIATAIENGAMADLQTSDYSYESIFEPIGAHLTTWASAIKCDYLYDDDDQFIRTELDGVECGVGSLEIANRIQLEFIDPSTESIYNKTPLQSLDSRYHASDSVTHKQIVDDFQELIDNVPVGDDDPEFQNMIDQISYVLAVYGKKVDLLPQLDLTRGAFPSKSSATQMGRFYNFFKRRIFRTNRLVKAERELIKKVIRNTKIIDSRTTLTDTYEAPEYEYTEIIDPRWYISREYDAVNRIYTNYGFFFVDYEKALYTQSAIAQAYNIAKLQNVLGVDIPYKAFSIDKISIWRYDDFMGDGYIRTYITGWMKDRGSGPTYPLVETVIVNSEDTYDDSNVTFPYLEGVTPYGAAGSGGEYGFPADCSMMPTLVVRAHGGVYQAESSQTSGGGSVTTADDMKATKYRLLTCEFQDYFLEEPAELSKMYFAEVVVRDNTKELAKNIRNAFKTKLDAMEEYADACSSLCSFNVDSNQFNSFFTEAITALYAGSEETAPWNTAPVVYHLFRDVVYDSFDGDKEIVADAAARDISMINPYNGNLKAVLHFYEQMNDMYLELWSATEGDGVIINALADYTDEYEHSFQLSYSNIRHWDPVWTTSASCEDDSECGTGEKCFSNGACVSEEYCTADQQCVDYYGDGMSCDTSITKCVPEEDDPFREIEFLQNLIGADSWAAGTPCHSNADCEDGTTCLGATDDSLGKCVATSYLDI